jgi:hypothetical protein
MYRTALLKEIAEESSTYKLYLLGVKAYRTEVASN